MQVFGESTEREMVGTILLGFVSVLIVYQKISLGDGLYIKTCNNF